MADSTHASADSSPDLDPTVHAITERIRRRSERSRTAYLRKIRSAADSGPRRSQLACSNLAHGFAGCVVEEDREALRGEVRPNIAIVSAYNDMLSAHQPFETYPSILKEAVREAGGVAQFAGGVPAMCDGVTQGEAGMELSLFSRDVIALATAIGLSHNMFDGALCLGVCDKIVPGLLIGALSFGHLPFVFVPAGPMTSGLSNTEKARVRQLYAEGKVGRDELLQAESQAYHSPGTCTFYGTANSNQMFMEILGLHVPGGSFANPGTALRRELTREAGRRVVALTRQAGTYLPLGEMIDERALVNAVVGLLATGGSTNHTIHLIAIARAAGISIDWQDFEDLSSAVPLLARVYPNGTADVNHFHDAGGTAFLIRELTAAGLLHSNVGTVADGPGRQPGLGSYCREAFLDDDRLAYRDVGPSRDQHILRPASSPFQPQGGLRLLRGNLGRCVVKTSAVKPQKRRVEAPAVIFEHQEDVGAAFERGELDRDFVAVVRFQGPRANGMPELHKLMPPLGVLQDRGFRVALVTDGRLSGASGKVPSAIHLTPEALDGPLAKVQDGDVILLDPDAGVLEAQVDEAVWRTRSPARPELERYQQGMGRELFGGLRRLAGSAEEGAMTFGDLFQDPEAAVAPAPHGRDEPRVAATALED
ncbi:MAG: phosphogluconate dehydratase [Thermoanaerobaculia bacterium]|nr:phosphogluconate dehydratase [Thermoanaerobaculia bacterium]